MDNDIQESTWFGSLRGMVGSMLFTRCSRQCFIEDTEMLYCQDAFITAFVTILTTGAGLNS